MEPERIGLLFVHGIGEQKRFEHVASCARQMAELIKCSQPSWQVAVTDNTATWDKPPGAPSLAMAAPVIVSVVAGGTYREYHCHEVWWADLGKRSSISETIGFWSWGLGQWCAPFYRRMDASGTNSRSRERPLTLMPDSAAESADVEMGVRWTLFAAGLAAILSVLSWSLLKGLVRRISGALPSPTLVVQFLGDVQVYEQRATPNRTALSDPGHPLRVGIRRRMVTEMVAMGARGYTEWHVVAHSLGTVLAYNGLTELGHTLPNYLRKELWGSLPEFLKQKGGVRRRHVDELSDMMPGRPGWLAPDDVINRRALFSGMRGFVTYGSPLDKFAAIWPRIVASADDQEQPPGAPDGWQSPFSADSTWLNIAAPHDPVSGVLDAYSGANGHASGAALAKVLPRQQSWVTPSGLDLGISHIHYLDSWARFARPKSAGQKEKLIAWLFDPKGAAPASEIRTGGPSVPAMYAATSFVLFLASAAIVWLGLSLALAPFAPKGTPMFCWSDVPLAAGASLAGASLLIAGAGLRRWRREAALDRRILEAEQEGLSQLEDGSATEAGAIARHGQIVRFAKTFEREARWAALLGAVLLAVAFAHDVLAILNFWHRGYWFNGATFLAGLVVAGYATWRQASLNHNGPKPPR